MLRSPVPLFSANPALREALNFTVVTVSKRNSPSVDTLTKNNLRGSVMRHISIRKPVRPYPGGQLPCTAELLQEVLMSTKGIYFLRIL